MSKNEKKSVPLVENICSFLITLQMIREMVHILLARSCIRTSHMKWIFSKHLPNILQLGKNVAAFYSRSLWRHLNKNYFQKSSLAACRSRAVCWQSCCRGCKLDPFNPSLPPPPPMVQQRLVG
jgi:hypothetical protein